MTFSPSRPHPAIRPTGWIATPRTTSRRPPGGGPGNRTGDDSYSLVPLLPVERRLGSDAVVRFPRFTAAAGRRCCSQTAHRMGSCVSIVNDISLTYQDSQKKKDGEQRWLTRTVAGGENIRAGTKETSGSGPGGGTARSRDFPAVASSTPSPTRPSSGDRASVTWASTADQDRAAWADRT